MRAARVICITTVLACALIEVSFARRKEQPASQGRVVLADGSFPELIVSIERVCKDSTQTIAYAGVQGRFSFDADDSTECRLRAYIPGYLSQNVASTPELGTLILRTRGTSDFLVARAGRNRDVSKNKLVWTPYEKGLDEIAKAKWRDAQDDFQLATRMGPWYPSAWLCLGIVQEHEGDPVSAKKSFKQAIKTDDSFVLPYVYAAALEVVRGDWQEALDDSKKVLQMDAKAFPGAWVANAWANLNLHNMAEAEKSAHEALTLDTEHRFAEAEYVLALVQIDKRDAEGAKQHLRNYLALDPHGRHSDAARAELNKP